MAAESFCCWLFVGVLVFVSAEQTNITADPGQNVTLPCRAPNNNSIVVVKYNRTDLGSEYVALYQDGYFVPDEQHPSYETRVDLQDEDMKDGDVSVILKNVKMNDTGTYKCHVAQREPNQERAMLKLLSSITLRVVDPPGPTAQTSEGGVSRGRPGLIASLSLYVLLGAAVVIFVIYRNKEQSEGAELQQGERSQVYR